MPKLRWNYHPDGYFIRFEPEGYALTHVQTYVPEIYRVRRDGEGRVVDLAGPRGIRLTLEYSERNGGDRENVGLLTRVQAIRGGSTQASWDGEAWTFVGNDLGGGGREGVMTEGEWGVRRERVREIREQTRNVIASAKGSDPEHPGTDLADLSHLRTALLEAPGRAPEVILTHLANAWQYALCLEAGGCPGPRLGWREPAPGSWSRDEMHGSEIHGPAVRPSLSFYESIPGAPLLQSGGGANGANIDFGGNVAAPGNTGSQRLLQSGKSPVERANLAMKALGVFLALADVVSSSGLGSAAYNALGAFGLPVGHLGIPTMLAGAMISQVVGAWSTATDALAGDTGSGVGGESGGDEGGESGESGEGWGGDPKGQGQPGDPGEQGTDPDSPGDVGGWQETRSDGQDFENTPPPSPPPNPSPPPPGNDVSPERTESYNGLGNALIETLYHTQSLTDSQLRQEAACQAGDVEWAQQQADLAGEHQDQAALGMMEIARSLEELLDVAEAEGVLESPYVYAEDFAGVQERLRTQGWMGEEMTFADALRITPAEMEGLGQYLISQDPEVMAGELGEAAALWAREMRTAGILWLALPEPIGGCR